MRAFCGDNTFVVFVEERLQDQTDERVFLLGKVPFLYISKHTRSTHLSDQKSLSHTAVLQSSLCSILEILYHQIFLNHRLHSSVPVYVSRYRLLNMDLFLLGMGLLNQILYWGLFLNRFLNFYFGTKGSEKVCSGLCTHRRQLLSKWIFSN
jgi:hypothetical protein